VFVSEAWSKIPEKYLFYDSGSYPLTSRLNNKPNFILVMRYILSKRVHAPILKMYFFILVMKSLLLINSLVVFCPLIPTSYFASLISLRMHYPRPSCTTSSAPNQWPLPPLPPTLFSPAPLLPHYIAASPPRPELRLPRPCASPSLPPASILQPFASSLIHSAAPRPLRSPT
jgi:hypothetical protein